MLTEGIVSGLALRDASSPSPWPSPPTRGEGTAFGAALKAYVTSINSVGQYSRDSPEISRVLQNVNGPGHSAIPRTCLCPPQLQRRDIHDLETSHVHEYGEPSPSSTFPEHPV